MSGEWAFWSNWPRPQRKLFAGTGILVLALIAFCFVAGLAGNSLALEWYLSTVTESEKLAVETISVGLFDIEIPAEVVLVRQHFEGSPWIIRPWTGTVYLSLLFFFYSILMALSTSLPRFWYLVATGVVIGLFVSMRLEQLLIFGWFDYKGLALALILFLPLSYYFHAFNKTTTLLFRLLSFITAFVLLGLVVYFGSGVERPFYTLAQYNFAGPVLLAVVFAVLVGHEVIYFILKMITRGKAGAGQKNWMHFFTFSIIYLVNVALVYARNAGFIDWDIIYLGEVLLLATAGVLGLWGLKDRESRYQEVSAFFPLGAFYFVALAGVSFTAIGYQLQQGNDPALEVFEDAIIFSQLGFGVMFLLYVIVNYINPLMANLPVYRIVFKEGTLPYTTYRLAGLIAVAAFYLLSNQVAFSQAIAGFYNGLGDLYQVRNQPLLSEQYYRQGTMYGYQNHKSNYQMGFISNAKEKPGEALYYFDQASAKHPSPHSFINLANTYQANRQFFKGIFALQEAREKFSTNGYIGNNLGVLYSSTNILDSALYYFETGLNSDFSSRAAKANIAYLAYLTGNDVATAELEQMIGEKNAHAILANAAAASIKSSQQLLPESAMALVPDSVLSGNSFPFVNNAALSNLGSSGNILSQRLPSLTDHPANGAFYGTLSVALALQQYFEGETNLALQRLDQVQQSFPSLRPHCFYLMGVMSLHQGAPVRAAEFLEQAAAENYPGASLNQAIALSEAGQHEQARLKWVLLESSAEESQLASTILPLYETDKPANLETDQQRYQFVRWFGNRLPQAELQTVWDSFEKEDMLKASMVNLAQKQLSIGHTEEAMAIASDSKLEGWNQPEFELLKISLALPGQGLAVLEEERNLSLLPATSRKVYQAIAAALQNNDPSAMKSAAAINPFQEHLMIATANYLADLEMEEEAHEVLVLAQQANAYSIPVLKAYIDLSLDMGFENYAESALIRLQSLLPREEYFEIERAFDQRVEAIEKARDAWAF